MRRWILGLAALAVLAACHPAMASVVLESRIVGAQLSNSPNYDWWYGCSPTSAGMLMGYYDIHGYGGLQYTNLIPGGVAELSTFGNPSAIANDAIASNGHIADFWTGYGNSGDDPLASGRTRPDDFDSLADFMGTSQDNLGVGPNGSNITNSDGSTTFWYYADGAVTPYTVLAPWADTSGMYGIYEYIDYCGYGVASLFNQYIDALGLTYGFTYADYMLEIDAGRPVLIHTANHTMLGYGYDAASNLVYVYDTWDDSDGGGPYFDGQNPGFFTWGGSYGGADHVAVTVLQLSGGVIPEPASILVWSLFGCIGIVGYRRRKHT